MLQRSISNRASLFLGLSAALALAACNNSTAGGTGDDTVDAAPVATIDAPAVNTTPDAHVSLPDAHVVATPDAPPRIVPDAMPVADAAPPDAAPLAACDYNEMSDFGTNDFSAEDSGTTLTTAPIVLCGTVASADIAGQITGNVDEDLISFSVANDGNYLMRLTAVGLDSDITISFRLQDSGGNTLGTGLFFSGHAVLAMPLTAGSYTMDMVATGTAPSNNEGYRFTIATDAPATRCVTVTTAANYVEAHDGTQNTGNDVVSIGVTGSDSIVNGTAEATNLTLTSGTSSRITGSSGLSLAFYGDEYVDRDSFQITTGATTNQLDVRINWSGTTDDLDGYLFPVPASGATSIDDVGAMTASSTTGPEFGSLAVNPNQSYLLWVGDYIGGAGSLTLPYDITVCASTFTPQ